MKVKVDWDLSTDDRDKPYTPEEAGISEIIDVPEDVVEEDITEWLSDFYGWCLFGWNYVGDYSVFISKLCSPPKEVHGLTRSDALDLAMTSLYDEKGNMIPTVKVEIRTPHELVYTAQNPKRVL
jgi:hypothetical protein